MHLEKPGLTKAKLPCNPNDAALLTAAVLLRPTAARCLELAARLWAAGRRALRALELTHLTSTRQLSTLKSTTMRPPSAHAAMGARQMLLLTNARAVWPTSFQPASMCKLPEACSRSVLRGGTAASHATELQPLPPPATESPRLPSLPAGLDVSQHAAANATHPCQPCMAQGVLCCDDMAPSRLLRVAYIMRHGCAANQQQQQHTPQQQQAGPAAERRHLPTHPAEVVRCCPVHDDVHHVHELRNAIKWLFRHM